ncbi:hypothetical protein ACQKP1_05415 [Allorhizobium sp. NPDC080224]
MLNGTSGALKPPEALSRAHGLAMDGVTRPGRLPVPFAGAMDHCRIIAC